MEDFVQTFFTALEEKKQWYDSVKLPEVLNNYRLIHTCVKTIYDILIKKSKIAKDPYKLEKKISEVVPPETTPFGENEKSVILGTRISDYESMLDFLCTYFKFSVSYMNLNRIKNLVDLNNSFAWGNLTLNSTNPNTVAMTELVMQLKQESDPLTVNTINDAVTKNAASITLINKTLKELAEFQHEVYKGMVRKDVMEHPNFNKNIAYTSPSNELNQIKKIYPIVFPKQPFYTSLIEEIIKEDQGEQKEEKQQETLKRLTVNHAGVERKVTKVDTKQMLMDAIYSLTALAPQISTIVTKIQENHDTLENLNNTGMQKFLRILRKAFNIAEPEVIYQVYIMNPSTKTEAQEKIPYVSFIKNLHQKSRYFLSFSNKSSPIYQKLEKSKPEEIIDFLNKNISECQSILIKLTGLDEYFKTAVDSHSSVKIKGLKMELTTYKNVLVKANQRRAEYASYIEEEAQMKKLGISNAE